MVAAPVSFDLSEEFAYEGGKRWNVELGRDVVTRLRELRAD
jgi:hypothetical protein